MKNQIIIAILGLFFSITASFAQSKDSYKQQFKSKGDVCVCPGAACCEVGGCDLPCCTKKSDALANAKKTKNKNAKTTCPYADSSCCANGRCDLPCCDKNNAGADAKQPKHLAKGAHACKAENHACCN